MAGQKLVSQTQELIQWEAYKKGLEQKLEDVKERIKEKTETERAQKKSYQEDLKTANWKIGKLMASMKETAEADSYINATITLDDFDTAGASLDVELAKGELKQEKDEEKED